MEKTSLHQQIATMRQSFFDEGILGEYFVQAEILGDDDPTFLEKLLTTYFRQSTECIVALENALKAPSSNHNVVERAIYKLKGASASIGAIKVCEEMDRVIQSCREDDVDGIKTAFVRVKHEHSILRSKLEPYFQMMRQAGPSESAVRPK